MKWTWLTMPTAAMSLVLVCGSAARAQLEQGEEETIVVTGARADQSRAFTEALSVAPLMADQLARWDGSICPGLVGMHDHRAAQYILDRIAQRALEVGLDVAEPGCLPATFLVYVTTDSDTLARELYENYRDRLGWAERGVRSAGRDALQDFVETPRPVRWRHLVATTTGDGSPMTALDLAPRRIQVFSPSRVRQSTRLNIAELVIIVDAQRVQGQRLDALADYVAMAGLAQLDLNTDVSAFPSVLNLFNDGAPGELAHTGMTEWDLAYLQGLYTSPANVSANRQASAIARSVQQRLDPEGDADLR